MSTARFFPYTKTAPTVYQTALESNAKKNDWTSAATSYTPRVAVAITAILAGVQTAIDNLVSDINIPNNVINSINIFVNSTAILLTYIFSTMATNSAAQVEQLTTEGIQEGWLDLTAKAPATTNTTATPAPAPAPAASAAPAANTSTDSHPVTINSNSRFKPLTDAEEIIKDGLYRRFTR